MTGALDAAAPFASPEAPVRLMLRPGTPRPDAGGLTISSESRDLPVEAANAAVARAFTALGGGRDSGSGRSVTWIKKIDSVLRGSPVEETLMMMEEGQFERCLFAPAFPDMGRRTREGMHEVRTASGDWGPAEIHDLRAAFRAVGREAQVGIAPATAAIMIGDAETQDALDQTTRALLAAGAGRGMLWSGSRGLAVALAGRRPMLPVPQLGAVIIGTAHRNSQTQVAEAFGAPRAGQPVLINPVPEAETPAATIASLRAQLPDLCIPNAESALMVIGGDTLSVVLDELRVDYMDCLGEIAPGLPISRISGSRFDGRLCISKSGGFGGPDLISRMIAGLSLAPVD